MSARSSDAAKSALTRRPSHRGAIGRRLSSERGAAAVLLAVLLIALLSVSAVVVDLADARVRVRGNQLAADLAGLAAGPSLKSDLNKACRDAWTYLLTNLPGLPPGATSPCDSGVPAAFPTTCALGAGPVDYQAIGEDPHEIVFVYPVPDGHAALDGKSFTQDGDPCERFAVQIRTFRSSFFGGIVGSSGLSAPAGSVVRAFEGTQSVAPVALLLLDPVGCEPNGGAGELPGPLLAVGQGGVKVYPSGTTPGFIALDSDGSDTSGDGDCSLPEAYTMDAQGGPSRIFACGPGSDPVSGTCSTGGIIQLFAMDPGQTTCNVGDLDACDHGDVGGRVMPQPTRLDERFTRAPVDHRYNCQTGYPVYMSVVPIPDCQTPTMGSSLDGDPYSSDHIDELRARIGTAGPPPGFATYSASGCDTTSSGAPIEVFGDVWVDCSPFIIKKPVTFHGNVVFQGGIDLTSAGGSLTVNPGNSSNRVVYIRSGDFVRSGQATLTMNRTTVYIHNGRINFTGGGGSQPLTWISPPDGAFEDLLLWSESPAEHFLAGQAGQDIEGVFFTPRANPFTYAGQGTQQQTKAQFLTYRLTARGQGLLQMAVDPDRAVLFPISGYLLIR